MRQLFIPIFLIAILSVDCSYEQSINRFEQPIVNGVLYDGHPSVGGYRIVYGGSCTATLVGHKTVLTAAHCIKEGWESFFYVNERRYDVNYTIIHPEYSDTVAGVNDIAVAILRDQPSVEPSKVSLYPPKVDQVVKLIGVGASDPDGSGAGFKRYAPALVTELTEDEIVYEGAGDFSDINGGNICFGDSGGPTFAYINGDEVQIGVHSYIKGSCGQQGNDMRVDIFLDWLKEVTDGDILIGGSIETNPPTVKFISPTLERNVYPLTKIEVRAEDDRMIESVILLIDGIEVETLTEKPYIFDAELLVGSRTLKAIATDGAKNQADTEIKVEVLPAKAFGTQCNENDECSTNLCADYDENLSYCSQICDLSKNNCPNGTTCIEEGGSYFCDAPDSLFDDGGCNLSHTNASEFRYSYLSYVLLLLMGWVVLRKRYRV